MSIIRKKLVVVGDRTCGKTCLLIAFCKNRFPEDYKWSILDMFGDGVEVDGMKMSIALWDAASQEGYARFRPLLYSDADVILICYSIYSRDSFEDIKERWIPDIKQYGKPSIPILLVANKKDLRNDPEVIEKLKAKKIKPISYEEGKALSHKIKAYDFLECSALTNDGVRKVFKTAARASLGKRSAQGCSTVV